MASNSYHLNIIEREMFAGNLRAAMTERNLTHAVVAKGLGLKNTSQVHLWTGGWGVPSPELLLSLAAWLRMSPHQLLPNGAVTRPPVRQYAKVRDHGGGVTVEIRVCAADRASVAQLVKCAEKLGVLAE